MGVPDDQVEGIAAVAGARNPLPRRVHIGQLRDCIEDGVEIDHHFAAPLLRDLINELLTEAELAARIGRGYDPALRRPRRRIPPGRPGIVALPLRSAVNMEDSGILPRAI